MVKKILLLCFMLAVCAAARAEKIKGSVKSTGGEAVEGVVVSDGLNIAQTDKKGLFSLEVDKDSRWVFISTPSGYRSSVTKGELEYYKKLQKGVNSYDFIVEKKQNDDTNHNIVLIADPQISDRDELPELAAHSDDIAGYVKELGDGETFGICLGDIVGWDHSIYPEYNKIMERTGLEFRNVIGNHDMTNYGRSYETSLKNYEEMYGPAWYSFNVGKVHYVVVNDNFFIGTDWYYIGYIDERQLQWLEKDLSYVPKNHKVVISMHIPTTLSEKDRKEFSYDMINELLSNKKAIYDLLKPYDALILSGHMHTANTQNISKRLTEINVTGLSGAWWCGPVCVDGSPAGYKVIKVRGDKMEWLYKGCGHPVDYQFKLYVGHESYPGQIVANVWDYDDLWRVEYFEDGVKVCDMDRFKAQDPQALELYKDPSSLKRQWVWAVPTENMFKAKISENAKSLEVKVTDRFGRVYIKKYDL
ncbi:MAG: calcineurin-like phosphoesterase C-terminal domain-containing protein [Bacteroidales bacterium]|nr:calcineurin-like phosphoesterase C-terminal domain-containing protein [Bacteroidales bacterium]